MFIIEKQFNGIRKVLDAGLFVKVNTVLIPGMNDQYMTELALHLRGTGVKLMNIMPLIPSGKMKNIRAPTCDELIKARQNCEEIIPQFYLRKQCRADMMFIPGD